MIPTFTLIRAISIVAVISLRSYFSWEVYHCLFYAVLFGHYLLAVLYSKKQLVRLLTEPTTYLASGVLILLCWYLIGPYSPTLLIYFGIHLALTDVYTLKKWLRLGDNRHSTFWTISRLSLVMAQYCYLFKSLPPMTSVGTEGLQLILAGTGATFLLAQYLCRHEMGLAKIADTVFFEIVGIAFVLWASNQGVNFEDAIFYHLIYWFLVPLKENWKAGVVPISRYVALTGVITAAFYIFTPDVGLVPQFDFDGWWYYASVLGYVHITSSFALARLNPVWIRMWFYQ